MVVVVVVVVVVGGRFNTDENTPGGCVYIYLNSLTWLRLLSRDLQRIQHREKPFGLSGSDRHRAILGRIVELG